MSFYLLSLHFTSYSPLTRDHSFLLLFRSLKSASQHKTLSARSGPGEKMNLAGRDRSQSIEEDIVEVLDDDDDLFNSHSAVRFRLVFFFFVLTSENLLLLFVNALASQIYNESIDLYLYNWFMVELSLSHL